MLSYDKSTSRIQLPFKLMTMATAMLKGMEEGGGREGKGREKRRETEGAQRRERRRHRERNAFSETWACGPRNLLLNLL